MLACLACAGSAGAGQNPTPLDAGQDCAGLPVRLSRHLRDGRYVDARTLVNQVRDRRDEMLGVGRDAEECLTRLVVRDGFVRRDWSALLALPVPPDSHSTQSLVWYVKGWAAARRSFGGVGPEAEIAREARRRLEALADRAGRRGPAEIRRLAVQAAIAASQEEREEMALVLLHAAEFEAASGVGGAATVLPIAELAGDLWLEVERFADARREYAAALEADPESVGSLLGLARASAQEGALDEARGAYTRLLRVWDDADPDLSALVEARQFLAESGRPGRPGRH